MGYRYLWITGSTQNDCCALFHALPELPGFRRLVLLAAELML
jgi:hypothetical protein